MLNLSLVFRRFPRWIDPGGGWLCRGLGRVCDEAFRGSAIGAAEGVQAGGVDSVGLAEMDLVGRHQADAGMVMLAVVPIEEIAAERLGILDAAEALGKLRLIFYGFEVAFRERIIVRGVRPAVGFANAEIGEQQRGGLGSHGTAAVGVQG